MSPSRFADRWPLCQSRCARVGCNCREHRQCLPGSLDAPMQPHLCRQGRGLPKKALALGCMAALSPTACSATGLAWQPGCADEAQEGAGCLQGTDAQEQALVSHIYLCTVDLP